MRALKLFSFLIVALIASTQQNILASAVTNNTAIFIGNVPGKSVMLQIVFKDFHLESDLTNISNYAVTQLPRKYVSKVQSINFSIFGATNIINGKMYRKDVNIYGDFNQAYTNDIIVKTSDGGLPIEMYASPLSLDTSSLGTNNTYLPPVIAYIWNNGQFGLLPYEGNGNGAGLAYTLNISTPEFLELDLKGDGNPAFRLDGGISTFGFKSSGNFGIATGAGSSNSVQDNLSAEIDYKFLANFSILNPNPTTATPRLVYPIGFVVSPAGFEWNKEFTFGNYTPKAYIGGAILPSQLNPAYWWSKSDLGQTFDTAHNPGLPPTLFTGYTYVSPIASNMHDPSASAVHDRWDSELIYDFPICRWFSLRYDWNSYIGLDRSFWAHYYEAGVVLYLSTATAQSQATKGGHGLFFGYANGEKPPNYTKTGSWEFGYSIQF